MRFSKVLLKFVSETFSKKLLQSEGQLISWSFLYKAFHKQTTREIKCLRKLPKVLLNLPVRSSLGSYFRVLCESSKRSALFTEERNAKLQSKLRENHPKSIVLRSSYQRFPIRKVGLQNFVIFTGKTFRSATLLKRDSNTGVFLWILEF